jgi:ketosteroid isomerase-like protein
MKYTLLYITVLFFISPAYAQQTDKVGQLVSAENFFAALAKEKGMKKAFLTVSDDNTLIFRPDPVQPGKFFKNKQDDPARLSWEPSYAKISKSGDWGFTTGPYTFKETDTSNITYYGQYLSVWKKNQKDIWKLALDLGIPHPKPSKTPKLIFVNPANEKFMHQYSTVRQKQREEIVFSSDELLATTLTADNVIARQTFLAPECRLLFPGYEPIVGKDAVTAFWQKQNVKLTSKPVKADRAYSGELAFTYGDASISRNGEDALYHYVRIWEVQSGFEWNVILEIYVEASKI